MQTFTFASCSVWQTMKCSRFGYQEDKNTDQKCSSSRPCCVSRRRLVQSGVAVSAAFLPEVRAAAEHEVDRPFFNLKRSFADVMQSEMRIYEDRIAPRKMNLFLNRVPKRATILDIGIGGGPNLKYLPPDCAVIGLEPNKFMWQYCEEKAEQLGLSLEIIDAYAESIPMPDASCDTVISTLTLCSVKSPSTVVDEIGRVLKPGGYFIFVEHTIAPPSEPVLRTVQQLLNPLQNFVADGCNINRDIEALIRNRGQVLFDEVTVDRFNAEFGRPTDRISLVRPHISGFARRSRRTA